MQRAGAECAVGLLCQLQGTWAFCSLIPEGGIVLFSTLTSLTPPPPHIPPQLESQQGLFSPTGRVRMTYGTFWAQSTALTLPSISLLPLHEPSVW